MAVSFTALSSALDGLAHPDRAAVVGLSGFGGSGKSTLAAQLTSGRIDWAVIPVDDFLLDRCAQRSDEWASVDRARLVEQVLNANRSGDTIRYQRYDWAADALADWVEVAPASLLLVEGIGILHPDLLGFFDLTIWVDMSLEAATERGRRRDKDDYGVDHDSLWQDICVPNENDYFERFRPDLMADLQYLPD